MSGTAPSRASETVRAAAVGFSAHVGWQFVSRVASFVLRAVVVRALGPERVADTELNVALVVSLLVLPISGFRKVSLRAPTDAHAVALCACCVAVTATVAVSASALLATFKPLYSSALAIVASSLIVRALAEPSVIFTVRRERYSENSRARAAAILVSGAVGAVSVRMASAANAAPATAMGHLAYSSAMLVAFISARGPAGLPIRSPKRMLNDLDVSELVMAAATTGQCFLKYVLSNGESFVLALTCKKDVQGAYILAGNVASIVARFFNDGLEDQCFNVFHRLAPAFRPREGKNAYGDRFNGTRESISDEDRRDAQRTCVATMHLALKATLLVAVLFASIGPAYAYSCVRLLYDVEWSEGSPAARLLSQYFLYLMFMAANGVTEAFFHAAAVAADSRQHWIFSAVLSVSYLLLLRVTAVWYQAGGIIAVNCTNMAMRTVYSIVFYCKLTKQSGTVLIRQSTPNIGVLVALAIARRISMASEVHFVGTNAGLKMRDVQFSGRLDVLRRVVLHSASGVFALVTFALSVVVFERQFLKDITALVRSRPAPKRGTKTKIRGEASHEHED